MALGMARLLGYRLPANFRLPMIAASLQEFWRRWHITLSRWLRDYLYFSLGGSRRPLGRTSFNIMVTMVLGGLWHGAGWNFVAWGAMHGMGLVVERILGLQGNRSIKGWGIGWYAATQLWVTVTWVLFRSPDLQFSMDYLAGMATFGSAGTLTIRADILVTLIFALPIVAHHAIGIVLPALPRRSLGIVMGLTTAGMLICNLTAISATRTFIYFKF
jgi:alginate O-acetyltransferase complex protein AlgI